MARLESSEKQPTGFAGWARRRASAIRVVSVCAIALGLFQIARSFPVGAAVGALSDWFQELGAWGPVVFGAIYVAVVLTLLPASAMSIAAGALFGVVVGTITVSLASTLGAALAFLIARHLARDAVARRLGGHPRFEALDRAVAVGGWKIVAMLRFSPLVPFTLQNYVYGLTKIRFWPCVLTTWITMFPSTLVHVYLGCAGRSGLETASGGWRLSPSEWTLLGVGLVATVAATVYVGRLARAALREHEAVAVDSAAAGESAPAPSSGLPWATLLLSAAAIGVVALALYVEFRPGALEGLFPRLEGAPPVDLREAFP